ncbi:LysR family transcriptional regulator [Nitrospirillum iridis]|uniref:DNA-binding transcriptional LysR family regulator n=1 Tax=Nitrospirillum iridis TaxID=765888 RepID=A0A7X0AWN3_9PROT|nr:LysR family transcriptional regulator [Nitrospirillum iridis]MBB6250465.1 DNA-binding transcriptional LysR family regulator [Nitrospirillum iridis]
MLDPLHLRTFVAITEVKSFSEAGRQLGLSQSSVSEHVKRLEQFAGQRLFQRDTHSNTLTEHGAAMLEFARGILEVNERAKRHFAQSTKRQLFRFGACEDLAMGWVRDIIRCFMAGHPDVDLDFTIALSRTLTEMFDDGRLDMVLCKRWPDGDRGDLVFRDQVVWASAAGEAVFRHDEAQLVLYPPPSITRFMALTALERAAVPWRIACTSGDLNGLAAATAMGVGMMAHSSRLLPAGVHACPPDPRLPQLGALEFVILERKARDRRFLTEMSDAIRAKAAAETAPPPAA